MRNLLFRLLVVAAAQTLTLSAMAAGPKNAAPERKAASEQVHRLLIQVDQNDPAVINLALNNATNVVEYYRSKGQNVAVDVVTYGPGLHMLRADTSPVQDRIRQMKDFAFPSTVQFSACNNTKEGMEKKEGHPVSILPDAVLVPSGVVNPMGNAREGLELHSPLKVRNRTLRFP